MKKLSVSTFKVERGGDGGEGEGGGEEVGRGRGKEEGRGSVSFSMPQTTTGLLTSNLIYS